MQRIGIAAILGALLWGGGLSAIAQTSDAAGNIYLPHFRENRVYKLSKDGTLSAVAGTGERGFSGDGGPAIEARFAGVRAVAVDDMRNLYIVDMNNHRIRRVDAQSGIVTTIAGTGEPGFSGDGDLAVDARLNRPGAIAIDSNGNVYVADGRNSRIRLINGKTGIITTFAGNGERGFSGDTGPATEARLGNANGLAFDKNGNLYFSDTTNDSIRRIDVETGIITTVAGNQSRGYGGDNGPATAAFLAHPNGLAVDGKGNIFIADSHNFRIRRIHPRTGVISTVAGTGINGTSGDGGPATEAELDDLGEVMLDSDGSLLFGNFSVIRRVDRTTRIITTVYDMNSR